MLSIDMKSFVPLWCQGLYPSSAEMGCKCQLLGGDSLLHVGILPAVLISCPLIPICLDPWRSVWLASNLCWNNADRKQAVTSWQQTLNITYSMLGYMSWCHGGTKAYMSMVTKWRSDVYRLLPVCHVYIEGRIKFVASVIVTWFLKLTLCTLFPHLSSKIFFCSEYLIKSFLKSIRMSFYPKILF
jgi:hypothetical protein